MTSKKELNVVLLSNGYQPVNIRWCPKSPGIISDRILLSCDESLLNGEDKKKKKKKKKKKNTIHESGTSNLLVDKTKSIDKSIIFVFTIALKVVLPKQQDLCKWKIGII